MQVLVNIIPRIVYIKKEQWKLKLNILCFIPVIYRFRRDPWGFFSSYEWSESNVNEDMKILSSRETVYLGTVGKVGGLDVWSWGDLSLFVCQPIADNWGSTFLENWESHLSPLVVWCTLMPQMVLNL
jgi:hypothetical protein